MEINTTQIPLPAIIEDRFEMEPVRNRLKWLTAKLAKRPKPKYSGFSLLDRFMMRRSRSRIDWLRAKLRWFVDLNEIAKVNANIEVESAVGGSRPELWQEKREASWRNHEAYLTPQHDPKTIGKASSEYAKLTQQRRWEVQPVTEEDINFINNMPKGGRDRQRKIESKVEGMRHLRLLELHEGEGDIEQTAKEIVEDIKMICSTPDSEASGAPVQQEEDFAPPTESTTSVWG